MESWDNIYKENAPKLIGICRRYVKDNQLAEDLVHEAFIIAMDKSNTYSGKGTFEGWLRRIVINTALQHLRKNKNVVFAKSDDVLEYHAEQSQDKHESENAPESQRNIIENVNFSQQELLETIDELPEHHKAVFNLYVIDEYTHKEIGELLNISPGTSKSHLARARKKLQQMLFEKSKQKKEDKDRKGFFWFLFGAKADPIDKLYKDKFKSFEIQPKKPTSFKDNSQLVNTQQSFSLLKTIMGHKLIFVSSLGLIVAFTVYFLYPQQSATQKNVVETKPEKTDSSVTAIQPVSPDTNIVSSKTDTLARPEKKISQPIKTTKKISNADKKPVPAVSAPVPKQPVVIHKSVIRHDTIRQQPPANNEK
jgi:RNA polymerase sigma factor (sigma-70 family)